MGENVSQDQAHICQCSELKTGDVPGSTLSRSPEKCRVNELRAWLQCRGQRVKSKETKAELCLRVRKCLEYGENLPLQDIFHNTPFSKRKKENCLNCSDGNVKAPGKDTESLQTWTKSTENIPKGFSYLDILKFNEMSGRSSSVEKPIDKGYKFYYDGYVFDEEVSFCQGVTKIRCRCYRSMKKNEAPHKLHVTLDINGKVVGGKCSCVAGIVGQCNHVYALLYRIEHVVKMKDSIKKFERLKTCTEKASQWQKSRTDGIRSEPVMAGCVIKPKFGSEQSGIKPTLYEARAGRALGNLEISGHVDELKKINPLFGVCQTAGAVSSVVKIRNGMSVPKGSPLSYHLSMTEGDFKVAENIVPVLGNMSTPNNSPPPFPWKDTVHVTENVDKEMLKSAGVLLDATEASAVCENTVKQSDSEAWFEARKNRLTASKFGAIVRRKKDMKSFVKSLREKHSLSNVPAVRYGKENEAKAVQHYLNYMNNTAKNAKVFQCGCVIDPKFPWLAASPDRIVYNESAGFGLMEVKCSYSKRNITPEDACFDPGFCCEMSDGKFTLKRNHEYYAQVQGQLGVCGAQYCDFVVFTEKGLGIERILFDQTFWNNMSKKLRSFYLQEYYPVIMDEQGKK